MGLFDSGQAFLYLDFTTVLQQTDEKRRAKTKCAFLENPCFKPFTDVDGTRQNEYNRIQKIQIILKEEKSWIFVIRQIRRM